MFDFDRLNALLETPQMLALGKKYEGKVRDNYSAPDGKRYIVVTDRISAFDRVLGTLPLTSATLSIPANRIGVIYGLNLPNIVSFGLSQELGHGVTLLGSATWFNWERFREIKIEGDAERGEPTSVQNYDNTWSLAVGTEYSALSTCT